MKVRISRQELKAEAELLALLEQYEQLQKATEFYSGGSLTVHMDGNLGKCTHKWYILQDSQPAKTLQDQLASIARNHYNNMIAQQIVLIKSKLEVELSS